MFIYKLKQNKSFNDFSYDVSFIETICFTIRR